MTLDVRSTDLPPIIESSPTVRAAAATTYRYQLVAYDSLGRALNYNLTSSAGPAAAVSASGEVTWVVPAGSTATQTFSVNVTATGSTLVANQAWSVTAAATLPDASPYISSTPTTIVDVNQVYSYQVVATDPDNSSAGFTYSLASSPRTSPTVPGATAMTISSTGLVQWTPVSGHLTPGTESFEVVVTSNGKTAKQRVVLSVRTPNNEPVIVAPPTITVHPGQLYAWDLKVTDADNDQLRYVLGGSSRPTGLTLDQNGRLRWQTSLADTVGTYNFTVMATDDRGALESAIPVSVILSTDATPPVVSIDVSSPAIVNQPLKINVSAVDTSGILGYTLTWTSTSNPYPQSLRVDEWGVATLTPLLAETYTFSVTARNGSGVISYPVTKSVSVAATTNAPVVTITSPSNFSTINSVMEVTES